MKVSANTPSTRLRPNRRLSTLNARSAGKRVSLLDVVLTHLRLDGAVWHPQNQRCVTDRQSFDRAKVKGSAQCRGEPSYESAVAVIEFRIRALLFGSASLIRQLVQEGMFRIVCGGFV